LWGAFTATAPAAGGTLVSDYEPVLLWSSGFTSHARQELRVDARRGQGVDAGARVFLARRFGVECGVTFSRAAIRGTPNSAYTVSLRYIGLLPPDYVPREYVFESSMPWPDTEGTVTYRSLRFGAAVRWGRAGARMGGTIAGGVSASKIDADVQSVAYTAFHLGGHSTLFSLQHRVVVSTADSGTVIRPYASGDVRVTLNRHAAVSGGIRVDIGSTIDVTARPDRLVDPDESLFPPDMTEVRRVLALGPVRLANARWHIMAGLTWVIRH
jgi:hypothetical protein